MFDKLEDLLIRYEELMSELSEPDDGQIIRNVSVS